MCACMHACVCVLVGGLVGVRTYKNRHSVINWKENFKENKFLLIFHLMQTRKRTENGQIPAFI